MRKSEWTENKGVTECSRMHFPVQPVYPPLYTHLGLPQWNLQAQAAFTGNKVRVGIIRGKAYMCYHT